ncbi:MAG: flagellar brake protein [Eubacterium sp.]|nr:flagellar brake protein [Eubacterium sp.]
MEQVFSIGNKIEITPVKSAFSYDKTDKRYASQLLDYDGGRMAKIAVPVQDGHLVPIRVDEDINMCFFTKAGLYQCRGRVKNRLADNNVSMLEVLFVSEPEKFQRRRYYRLECTSELRYRRLSKDEVRIREELERAELLNDKNEIVRLESELDSVVKNWQVATVTNLSAGGVRFHLAEHLEIGEPIGVVIPLSMKSGVVSMEIMAHVIESGRSEDTRSTSSDVRCEFDSLTNQERERIVKYVFEEQRRRMAGGDR